MVVRGCSITLNRETRLAQFSSRQKRFNCVWLECKMCFKSVVTIKTLLKGVWVFLLFISIVNCSATEDYCSTPDALLGSCILLQECEFIQKTLKYTTTTGSRNQLLHSYHCGFEGSLPKVCCPPEPRDPPSTSTPTLRAPDVTNHKNLKLLDLNACGPYAPDKIIEGFHTDPHLFPWMALISYRDRTGLSFRCSGTIINKNYILTAAHCITHLTSMTLAGVRLGEYNTETDPDCYFYAGQELCKDPVQDFSISEVIPHPYYNATKFGNDIGLLRLKHPANLTVDTAAPICLPIKETGGFKAGSSAIVTGWGVTETGFSSSKLLKVTLPIITNEACQGRYDSIKTRVQIGRSQVCAGGTTGKDTCAGDGGGPLGKINTEGHFTQYGIVSFGSRFCGLESLPGVYTRVDRYMSWILDNIRA